MQKCCWRGERPPCLQPVSPLSQLCSPTFWQGKKVAGKAALASLSTSAWQHSFWKCFFFSPNSIKSFVASTIMSICLSTQCHGTAICTYQPHFPTELKITLKLLEVWVNREKFRTVSIEANGSNHSKFKNRCRREEVPNLRAKLCNQVLFLVWL